MPTPRLGITRRVRVNALQLRDDNPRNASDSRIRDLAASMEADPDFMRARPIIATPDGLIIAGEQRYRAALSLGRTHVDAIYLDGDAATQAARMVRDNTHVGEWDEELLAAVLTEHELDAIASGLTQEEIDAMLAPKTAPRTPRDPDDAPPLPQGKPDSQLGTVYELGPHLLLCGDALDLRARCGAGRVSCLLTDPPYGISQDTDYEHMSGPRTKQILPGVQSRRYAPVIGDDEPFNAAPIAEAYDDVLEQFWFGADYYRRTLPGPDAAGAWLVWDKRNEASDNGFGSGFELVWSRAKHQRRVLRHYFFGAFGADGAHRMHPTQKPVPMLTDIIERWTKPGQVIADPYAGSGSILIAAHVAGRVCITSEIDPRYCDVIRQRYEASIAI